LSDIDAQRAHAMKLDTAIRETVLREAKVVAGEENLDRDIAWVHMVDHPDIAQWVKSGELLLTTGYNWPTDANASRHLVCELAKAGLAGVVLAIPKFRDHFPPEAVEEAQRVGLPMFELPWAVPFSQVTHEILAKIINFQASMIERSEQLHRALTNAAVSASSLSDIAHTLTTLLGRQATFTDTSGRVLGSSTHQVETQQLEQQFIQTLAKSAVDITVLRRPVLVPFQVHSEVLSKLSIAVYLQDKIVAILWLDLEGHEADELDMRALEHASIVAALHLMHQQQLSQQEDRLGYALVAGLLDGEFSPSASALERAKVRGWNETTNYRVCLVLLDEPIPLTTQGLELRERWVEKLKRHLRASGNPELIAIWLNQIKFILSVDTSADVLWTAIGDKKCAMAVSRVHTGIDGMAQGSKDVDALLSSLRPGRLHDFDEILFPRALLGDTDARGMLINRLITPLMSRPRGEALLETLEVLANGGFQLAHTARALDIHISTMRYRLEQIEKVLGVTFEDSKVRFQVQVAMTLYRLQQD
jgi:purine catabolism regulator